MHHTSNKLKSGYAFPLSNRTLFQCDDYVCYMRWPLPYPPAVEGPCAPCSQGGEDQWNNLVAACMRCNNHKADRIPEAVRMGLLAIPFTPKLCRVYLLFNGSQCTGGSNVVSACPFPSLEPLAASAGD